jgi:Ca2+-binding RTX toxin-like protein
MPTITPLGVETLVNTSTNQDQFQPTTTQLSNGRYIVVWADYFPVVPNAGNTAAIVAGNYANADIKAQIFEADGTRVGGEILVNTTTAGAQFAPRITELTDGNFLIAWQDGTGLTFGSGATVPSTVRAQEFTANGVAVGSDFAIGTAGVQSSPPAITAVAGGGFVAFWQEGYLNTTTRGALVGQVFDNTNTAIAPSFVVDNTNLNTRTFTLATTLANGDVAVAWANRIGPSPSGISYRVYSAPGAPVSAEQNLGGGGGQFAPLSFISSIAALANGGFAIAFVEDLASGMDQSGQIAAFDQAGNVIGIDEYTRLPLNNFLINADIAALPNGGLVISYVNELADGNGTGINAILYSASGNVVGNPILVNTTTALDQFSPNVSALSNGDIVFTWVDLSGTGGDISGAAIRSQVFDVNYTNAAPVAVSDSFGITLDPSIPGGPNEFILDTSRFLDNDTDSDNDTLEISSITNVQNGTVALGPNDTIIFTRTAGSYTPITFNYTVTDGNLFSAPASATVGILLFVNDTATVRGIAPVLIDVLANDILPGSLSEYQINSAVNTTAGTGVPVVTVNGQQYLSFQPTDEAYFGLAVGQTSITNLRYFAGSAVQSAGGAGDVRVTLQGWAQLGGAGDDNLVGGALADHLVGGGGVNSLTGGDGNDYYTVENATTTVVETANAGIDTVRLTASVTNYILPENVENLVFLQRVSGFADVSGNSLNNSITSNPGTTSILRGLGGNDILTLAGGGGDITPSQLYGGDGNDQLSAQGSNPVFSGGAGNDFIQGSNNFVYDGPGISGSILDGDLISYTENQGAIYTDIAANFTLETALQSGTINATTAVLSQDRVFLIDNVVGSEFGDRIYGTDANNYISGGAGSDIIYALDGQDTISYSSNAGAVYVDLAANIALETGLTTGTVSAANAVISTDYIYSLEYVIGSAFGDRIYGTTGYNRIEGGAGNDIIYALEGNDLISGGDGDDAIIGGAGADNMTGGAGADRFYFTEIEPNPGFIPGTALLNVDSIVDFVQGVDKIYINRTVFGLAPSEELTFELGSTATAVHSFLWDSLSNFLRYDADGAGGNDAVIVTLSYGNLSAADIVLYG